MKRTRECGQPGRVCVLGGSMRAVIRSLLLVRVEGRAREQSLESRESRGPCTRDMAQEGRPRSDWPPPPGASKVERVARVAARVLKASQRVARLRCAGGPACTRDAQVSHPPARSNGDNSDSGRNKCETTLERLASSFRCPRTPSAAGQPASREPARSFPLPVELH